MESERLRGLSRAVRSRVTRRVGWQGWAAAGVRSRSRDGRFFLPVGGYGQLVGNQFARQSSFGMVILSEILSPNYDLNSSTVRSVLRGWIAHGDVAAVWLTQPLTSFLFRTQVFVFVLRA